MTPQIVIDYELEDAKNVENLIRHVYNLNKYYNNQAKIEVVAYGPGIKLLMKNSEYSEKVIALSETGTTFVACRNTMQRLGLTKDELIDVAIEALSGLGHIVDRQLADWAYLKAL